MVRYVLRAGTKVSLLVRSHKPSLRCYTIDRSVPNPPTVKADESGEVLTLTPKDVMPGVEVFGQHEISEFTKSPENSRCFWNVSWNVIRAFDSGRKSKLKLELRTISQPHG